MGKTDVRVRKMPNCFRVAIWLEDYVFKSELYINQVNGNIVKSNKAGAGEDSSSVSGI